MIIKKQIELLLIIFLIICPIFFAASSMADNSQLINLPRKHVIKDVEYVKQETSFYCMFACYEMLLKHEGIKTNQLETLFNSGAAYSLGYDPIIDKQLINDNGLTYPSDKFYIHSSYEVSQGKKDNDFLFDLYGYKLEKTSADNKKNSLIKWIEYWEIFKKYIAQDIPVLCCIDPYSWPLYLELENIQFTNIANRGCHMIIGLGYNITDRTICFHDPYAGYKNQENKGRYQWVSMDDFRVAVQKATFDLVNLDYTLYTLKKQKKSFSRDEIFQTAYQRNIKRMKGDIESYYDFSKKSEFKSYGIQGFKSLKQDFKNLFRNKLLTHKILNKFTNGWIPFDMIYSYKMESIIKHDISNYLKNIADEFIDEDNQNIAKYNSMILEKESVKLDELSKLAGELKIILETKSLTMAYLDVKPVLKKIDIVLDEIISNQEAIIAGPSD